MLFEDTYLTIDIPAEGSYKEKGSKFLAFAYPVQTEAEIKELVTLLKKEYYDARHHCYAYILGFDKAAYRLNDDGEPSGTAGKPIYGQLLSHDLTNTLIVVVRYFGGTKLGVSGLIQAYKAAAKDALDNSKIVQKIVKEIHNVYFNYNEMNEVIKILKDNNVEQIQQQFDLNCMIQCAIRANEAQRVCDVLNKIPQVRTEFKHIA